MQPRQNIIATHPEQQPTQTKGTPSPVPHTNRFNGCNYSFKTAELRAHKLHCLAAFSLRLAHPRGQTYPRISASSRCNSVGVQTFLSIIFARKPMKNRLFQRPLPTSLNGKGIAPILCRLNPPAHPDPLPKLR